MSWWEITVFFVIVLALAATIWLLNRSERRTKNKWKLTAYKLLEEKDPDPEKVLETVKFLRVYGGRFAKDPEFMQLDKLLCDLYREIKRVDISDTKTNKVKK
jgi:hypothetical protein